MRPDVIQRGTACLCLRVIQTVFLVAILIIMSSHINKQQLAPPTRGVNDCVGCNSKILLYKFYNKRYEKL